MVHARTVVVSVLSLSLWACSGDDAKSPSDAGDAGGGSGNVDSGGVTDAGDAALTWTPDTGVGLGDAGAVSTCGNGTRGFFFAIPTTLCKASTRDCVLGCEDPGVADKDKCRGACIDADDHEVDPAAPWAKCDSCIYSQLFECGYDNGCEAAVNAFFCCSESKCPAGSADGCTDAMCGAESMDAVLCIYSAAPDCLDYSKPYIGACFETMDDEDAGVGDAGK